jgi:hypothetical protein
MLPLQLQELALGIQNQKQERMSKEQNKQATKVEQRETTIGGEWNCPWSLCW